MADILPFPPSRPASAARLAPRQQVVTVPREVLEEAAHAALDAADRLIAILDTIDDDADREDGTDDEPSLGAPEEYQGSNVVWLRGTDRDTELDQQQEMTP